MSSTILLITLLLGVAAVPFTSALAVNEYSSSESSSLEMEALNRQQTSDIQVRGIVQDFIQNIVNSAIRATAAVHDFTKQLDKRVQEFNVQVEKNLDELRKRIKEAVDQALDQIQNTAESAQPECVAAQNARASDLIATTVNNVTRCAEDGLLHFTALLRDLSKQAEQSAARAEQLAGQAKACSEGHGNPVTVSACFARVGLDAQSSAITLVTKVSVLITRIGISFPTVPLILQNCASRHLVTAGVLASEIAADLSNCAVGNN